MNLSYRRLAVLLASASVVAACATTPVAVAPPAPPPAEAPAPAEPPKAEPVPVSALASQVSIPHESFTLDNGLKVIVHEDRKAPIVSINVWYNVGSKDEPKGKTGFAHLFEHLMYNGSENLPGDFFEYLQQIGATGYNGTTWFDRTNYFENVPTGALERGLFLESDRMGYLLGAITQEKLTNQIGVVQNEKRQGDNEPGGLVGYEVLANLFPDGHPYQHDTIGSMADLDSATLADVKRWFIDKYGPNNAVVVLAGDIGPAQARPLMEKYFGAIPRGPVNTPAAADVPTLAAPKSIVMKDKVAAVQLQRHWVVPGMTSDQLPPLEIGASILGGLTSSRLDRILVRDEKLAVQVSADVQPFQRISLMEISVTVKPGVDPAMVDRRLDEILSDYLANGPSADEVRRAATDEAADRIRALEQVGGKSKALAEGVIFVGDSNYYRQSLDAIGAATPESVRTAMRHWLGRPVFKVTLEPGVRPPYIEAKGTRPKSVDLPSKKTERPIPPVSETPALDFPEIQHVRLSNGVTVEYAHRSAVPTTQIALSFDAGFAADAPEQRGLSNFAARLLDEGAAGKTSQQIAEEAEGLGADINATISADRTNVVLSALSANLVPSLRLLADVVQRPDFSATDVERVRAQTLTAIAQTKTEPNAIAARALPPLIFGSGHPYATTSLGDEAAIKAISRDDLVAYQQRWLRPDTVKIYVVSDQPLAELLPKIEAQFGGWTASGTAKGTKNFTVPPARPSEQRIVLIDRPGSPQSVIYGGQVVPVDPRGDIVPVGTGNEVFGGSFLSRINMDLRETKGWSYGVRASFGYNLNATSYTVHAPVQADRTGESIAALRRQLSDFVGQKGITQAELDRAISNNVLALPGKFETGGAVLNAMMSNDLYGRPDDYQEQLAGRYRGLTRASTDGAFRTAVDPGGFVWVVVGDAAKVKPQLARLKMPVEVVDAK